ncbi:DUF2505 family protein [Corynebacterium kalidii]|uniref:DUF2505 domain-containing protein n=1 Tax=Corynebacterium kalidii TaxID=2931982 RepID=A0A9X1WHI9_9CORY|nr:DUF2505 family protein [Corynebacterium kalidii]MCJ7859164.1 DUF2505 domain-containing protein [Corynebacterium kalidii]
MTKTTELTRTIDLPLETVRDIVSSEDYLLTVDDASTSKLVLSEAERTVDDDGTVHARVVAAQEKEDGSPGFGIEQITDITPVSGDGFVATTVTPLPKGIGKLTMVMNYTRAGESTVTAHIEVIADCRIPLVGGKIAKKLLESSDEGVDKAVDRIRRMAAG